MGVGNEIVGLKQIPVLKNVEHENKAWEHQTKSRKMMSVEDTEN